MIPTYQEHQAIAALPWNGVTEVLRGWSGKGQIYGALATVLSDRDDSWSPRDVERRARRILFSELRPLLKRWPTRSTVWREALPAESIRLRTIERSPVGKVDWVATRLRGWPPETFDVHHRQRRSDQLLTTLLKWSLVRLRDVRRDAVAVLPGLDADVFGQIDAALAVLDLTVLQEATSIKPTSSDLRAARASGPPWRALADVAERLLTEDRSLENLARRMVLPDDDLRWRLFHLGCLGTVIMALRDDGAQLDWLRPLGAASKGPAFAVRDRRERVWHLWFEAAGMWSYYGKQSPYRAVRRSLPGAARPIGADLALVLPDEYALVIECKYSSDVSYVGRAGYEQGLAYLTESRSGLVPRAAAAVVGADGVVTDSSTVGTACGDLTITSPSRLHEVVRVAVRSEI